MSAALKLPAPTTLEEFLEWERGLEMRFEWDGVQAIAMVGGSFAHTEIATRLSDALRQALRGGPCTVVRADLKVVTWGKSRGRYPDLVVTCSPIRPKDLSVPDPLVIVEVLSDSTAITDLGVKVREYGMLPSMRRYIALSSDERFAFVFTRENGWQAEEKQETLDIVEIGVSIALEPIYRGLL
jgi:Uma2 family endonuclease